MTARTRTVDALLAARRFRLWEALPLCIAGIVYLYFPGYLPLATQILIMILFGLSLDVLLGYTGIVTLGHAAYFGVGAYTAGILAVSGWNEPISGLIIAMLVAAVVGAITGAVIIRTSGLALLMLGMAVTLLLREAANHMGSITGGADGLQGMSIRPILGFFAFDIFSRVGFVYSFTALFVAWLFVRHLVNSPFGRSLVGIRENPTRMAAIGVPVQRRKLIAFTIGAALAGLAGALSAQTNQFVGLDTLSFELSGTVLVSTRHGWVRTAVRRLLRRSGLFLCPGRLGQE